MTINISFSARGCGSVASLSSHFLLLPPRNRSTKPPPPSTKYLTAFAFAPDGRIV